MRTLSRSTTSFETELQQSREAALVVVMEAVTVIRAKFVTNLPGQEMLYLEKRAQAVAFLEELVEPTDLTPFPLITAEVGITAPDANSVAQVYVNLNAFWQSVAAPLETIRLGAVLSIENATSQSEIDTALASFSAQLELFS